MAVGNGSGGPARSSPRIRCRDAQDQRGPSGCRLVSCSVDVPHAGTLDARSVSERRIPRRTRLPIPGGPTHARSVGPRVTSENGPSERSAGVQGGQGRYVTPPLLPRDPRLSGPGQQDEVARGLEETGTRAGNGAKATFPAQGYAVLPLIAPSVDGFRRFSAGSSSEHLQFSRDLKGTPPAGSLRHSAHRGRRRPTEGGRLWEFPR